ncbi:MAG TPA: transaldolase, partial [Isosphaeraceae bacterium]
VTSNPTIFEKAIGHSADYDADIRRLVASGADEDAIYRELTVADIGAALDLFRPTYDRTGGYDGYVSLEVSPLLALDSAGTIAEAKALWGLLDRPNAMIKIPGTTECLPAIEEALVAGININVTLLFSVEAYERVARAFLRALRRRADAGQPLDRVASVASFFVSRIDSEVDKRIDAQLKSVTDPTRRAELEGLKGKAAIANAKNAYALYQDLFEGPDFAPLKAQGAQVQRLLWASVGTKNPSYPDTIYVDELIGPETVSTMPPATYDAVKDHGNVRPSLTDDTAGARQLLDRLAAAGIDFQDVTAQLLREGVASFSDAFAKLMNSIRGKREQLLADQRRGG